MSDSRLLSSRNVKGSLARRIGLAVMVGLIAFATVASLDAEARRLGGGRSIGRQQSSAMQRQTTPPAQSPQQAQQSAQAAQAQRAQPAPTPAAAPNRSRWLGPIAGLAAGLGIAALPDYLVEDNSRLVQLFGESDSIQLDTYFVYPEELKTVARVQVFRDFVVSKAQRWPS